MNVKRLIPVVIVIGLLAGGIWIDQRRAAVASRLSGFFESQPSDIASRLPGRVAQILVKEGDVVKMGTLLVRLEAKPDAANLQAKLSQADQSQAALAEVENGPRKEDIARQQAAVDEAAAALARLKNGNRPEEIRAGVQRYEIAAANYRRALAGARPQEIEQARAAEAIAFEKYKAAQRGLTPEERGEAFARLQQVKTGEELASRELTRTKSLFDQGVVSQQLLDRAQADFQSARAKTQEQQKAYDRVTLGTPPEELAQSREGFRQAKATADLITAGSRKEDRVLRQGARPEDIAAAQARLDSALASLRQLKNGSRIEDIAQARAYAQAAHSQAASAKATLQEQEVIAPFDGVVERVLVADGDLLASGQAAIRMADPKDIWLRVYVPAGQLAKIRSGDSALLLVDGIEGEVPAKVESIATKGEFTPANLQTPEERAKQVFAVRLRLDPPNPQIKAGMGATVRKVGMWP